MYFVLYDKSTSPIIWGKMCLYDLLTTPNNDNIVCIEPNAFGLICHF